MAGQYVEITNPGYATLWVKDLPYVAGTGDAADTNPLNPQDARALIEGEWLQEASTGRAFTRGGDNSDDGANLIADDPAAVPSWPFFMEKGRYDAQASKLCHVIRGPMGYEMRTKVCDSTGLAVGDPVAVFDIHTVTTGVVRRGLAKATGGEFVVGRVTRIHGTNDISVVVNHEGIL